MSFNSYFFVLVFLPVAIVIYHLLNERGYFTVGKWFLLFMSVCFYAYAGLKGLLVICILILINYGIYKYMYKNTHAKISMILGIVINIASLIFFKYLTFIEITSNKYLGTKFTFVNLLVPLGVSFITFSQISFLVDEYKNRDNKSDISILDYAIYVLFFPKVTVGPIALSTDFIPQLNDTVRKKINWDNMAKGLMTFSFGIAKKMLIADLMAKYVDYGYLHCSGLGTLNALIVMFAYTMQIYFDFSGFCDMATGICLMLNFDMPLNFNSPYRSLSIGEFWDRWHITLTKFFTKYVYIPLGGNRKGKIRTYINIMIVFILSGIWHGASVTFIIWGLLHGIASLIERAFKNVIEKIPKAIRWCGTFIFVNIAWVFFRAYNLQNAIDFLKELISFEFTPISSELVAVATPKEYEIIQWIVSKFTNINTYYTGLPVVIFVLLFAIFASIKMKNTDERIKEFASSRKYVFITVLLLVLSVISLSEVSSFIYVNF